MKMATKFQQGGRGSLDDKVEKENSEREKEGMCQESVKNHVTGSTRGWEGSGKTYWKSESRGRK